MLYLENGRDHFFSHGQMTEYRVGPQHNLLNTGPFQTNSVDYLKNAELGCECVGECIPTPKFVQTFLGNGTF